MMVRQAEYDRIAATGERVLAQLRQLGQLLQDFEQGEASVDEREIAVESLVLLSLTWAIANEDMEE